ncbi:MAG: DUF692 domain-containing protein [Alphaproteobacteria bacterium]|nr:DUF692 domain-containing protein [Alphaproteobacteria bacterium]
MTKFTHKDIPNSAGVGLKAQHYKNILDEKPPLGWFEVHPENYMGAGGPPHQYLTAIRELYPLSLHGVGMSLGSPVERLNPEHLARFKALVERYEPGLISEHLAWSTHEGVFYNDLLPLPYTDETLNHLVNHVNEMQDYMGRQVLIENPSVYLAYDDSPYAETEFLRQLAKKTGCGLLLDVNNIFVSASNQGYDPYDYLAAFPVECVGEIHLGGHVVEKVEEDDKSISEILIDAHSTAVVDDVWGIYNKLIGMIGAKPSLMEWDGDIPEWKILYDEAQTADGYLAKLDVKVTA